VGATIILGPRLRARQCTSSSLPSREAWTSRSTSSQPFIMTAIHGAHVLGAALLALIFIEGQRQFNSSTTWALPRSR